VQRLLAGMFSSPHAGNKTLSSGHVRRILVTKLLKHHPLLGVYTKYDEDRECDQVRWTCQPVGKHKRLTDGIQQQRYVHGVAAGCFEAVKPMSRLTLHVGGDAVNVAPVLFWKTVNRSSVPNERRSVEPLDKACTCAKWEQTPQPRRCCRTRTPLNHRVTDTARATPPDAGS
jgi:hypothetical protein